jgi:hypothetical protein
MQVNLSLDLTSFEFDIGSLEVMCRWGWRFGALNGLVIPERGTRAELSLEIQRGRGVCWGLVNEGLVRSKTLS